MPKLIIVDNDDTAEGFTEATKRTPDRFRVKGYYGGNPLFLLDDDIDTVLIVVTPGREGWEENAFISIRDSGAVESIAVTIMGPEGIGPSYASTAPSIREGITAEWKKETIIPEPEPNPEPPREMSTAQQSVMLMQECGITLDGKGKPKKTETNVRRLLDLYKPGGQDLVDVRFETVQQRAQFHVDGSWFDCDSTDGELIVDDLLETFQADIGMEITRKMLMDALLMQARRNQCDILKDEADALADKWDGTRRLNDYLYKMYKVDKSHDSHYVRAVGKIPLHGAMLRSFVPGAKVDNMLILVGPQAAGKSSLMLDLFGKERSAECRTSARDKEIGQYMIGKRCLILDELESLDRMTNKAKKTFLSATEDRLRIQFKTRYDDFPRTCVFVGTTNEDQIFDDVTGDRRYLVVRVKRGDLHSRDWLRDNREQLLAEAAHDVRKYLEEGGNPDDFITAPHGLMKEQLQHNILEPALGEIIEGLTHNSDAISHSWLGNMLYDRGYVNDKREAMRVLHSSMPKLGWVMDKRFKGAYNGMNDDNGNRLTDHKPCAAWIRIEEE